MNIAEILNTLQQNRDEIAARLDALQGAIVGDFVIRISSGCYIVKKGAGFGGGFGVQNAAMFSHEAAKRIAADLWNADGSKAEGEVVNIKTALAEELKAADENLQALRALHNA